MDLTAGLIPHAAQIDLSAGLVPAQKIDLSAGLVPYDPGARFSLGTGSVSVYRPTAWDRIRNLFDSRPTESGGVSPLSEAIGGAIPQGAIPALVASKKYAVDPLNQAAAFTGARGKELLQFPVKAFTSIQNPPPAADLSAPLGLQNSERLPVRSEVELQKLAEEKHPYAMGIAGGVGEIAGSTIGDPRNWPFFASSAARPLLQRAIARGFAQQMSAQTYQGARDLYDNWDKLTPNQRAEIGTKTGVGALFAMKGLMEGVKTPAGETRAARRVTDSSTAEGVKTHNEAFAQAKEEMPGAGPRDLLQRAQQILTSQPSVRIVDSSAAARELLERDTILPSNTEARTTGPTDVAAFRKPSARVVNDGHIPVVSQDEVLAHAVTHILTNSAELKNAGVDVSTIKTDRDIDAVLMRASDLIKSGLPDRAHDRLTFEIQKEMAAHLNMTVDQFLANPGGTALNAENLLAARMVLKESYNHVLELARAGDTDAAMTALSQHKAIQERVAGVRAESGRALGSFRIDKADLPATKIQNVFEKLPPELQTEAAKLISKLDQTDPQSVRTLNQLVEKIKPTTTLDKLFEYYRNALLSSPHTIIVKTASEASMVAMEAMKKAVAGGIAKFKDSPDRFASEAYWYAKGMQQALAEHWKAVLSGEFQLEGSPGFERASTQAIKGRVGSVIRTPSEAMSRMTNLLYLGNFEGEINSLAARAAIAEGLEGDAFTARQEYLSHHPTEEMQESAHKLALTNTFQSRLGAFGEKIGQAIGTKPTSAWLPESLKSTAPLRWLFPFYKTPVNLVKATITHATPYELLNGIAKGDTDALARGLVGSSIAASLATLALSGHLTGGGPTDFRKAETKRATGWQPYSLKIGDKYYSYHRFEPVGLAAGMIADTVHGIQSGDSEVVSQSKADTAVKHIARNLDDMPFMGTLANLLQAVHDPVGGRAQSFINREAGSIVPAGIANVAETLDPTVRRPQSALQAIESRIPGLTAAAPAIVDIAGRSVQRPFNNLGGANAFPVSSSKGDPVVDELSRLGISTPQPPKGIKWRGKPTQLTDQEREQFSQQEGQELYKRVGRAIQSGSWQKRTDDQKRRAIVEVHRMIDESRPARLTKIRKQSQAELARDSL
jgi:hypothetical protein